MSEMEIDWAQPPSSLTFRPPPWDLILRAPLPHLPVRDRPFCRGIIGSFRGHLLGLDGLEHIHPDNDPFVLVMNHNKKLESVILPTLFVLLRSGKHIHFLADWNYMLIPGIGYVMRRGRVIPVTRKPARPAFLNVFKPLFRREHSSLTRARHLLQQGRSIGLFPEGRINHDPDTLLSGSQGAARLSLKTEVPIVPAGISFPLAEPGRPLPRRSPMHIRIGPPMQPSPELTQGRLRSEKIAAWHDQLMRAISSLSDKTYPPRVDLRPCDARLTASADPDRTPSEPD